MSELTAVGPADAIRRTNRHYDLPPKVFAAFLGRRMKYTCGLFASEDATLDQAQEAKLHFIAASLGLTGGEHVLDVGCGWGSLTIFLAETYGCRVLAVAPSCVQTNHVRRLSEERGLRDRVDVRCTSIQDVDLIGLSFPAVAMVGVIEHMPDHSAVLAKLARHLRLGGRLYVSASCHRDDDSFREFSRRPASRHVLESIFGFGTLRPLSELVVGAEDAGLSLSTIVDLTSHYNRTIEEWMGAVACEQDAIEAAAPGLPGELLKYFATTNAGWGYTTKHYAFTAVRARLGETVLR